MSEKWYPFDQEKGYRQKRPPLKKYVLVAVAATQTHPIGVAVGYRKDAAGDKSCPYFVVPHFGHGKSHRVFAWCDCLQNTFAFPREEAEQ